MHIFAIRSIIIESPLSEKEVLYRLFLFAHSNENRLLNHFTTGWKFDGIGDNNAFSFTYYKSKGSRYAYKVAGNISRNKVAILTLSVSMASYKFFYIRSTLYLLGVLVLILPNAFKGDFVKIAFLLPLLLVPMLDYMYAALLLRKRSKGIVIEIRDQVQCNRN